MQQYGRLKNSRAWLRFLAPAIALTLAAACSQVQPDKAPLFPDTDFTLSVLHTNDTHSVFGGTTDKGLICYAATCEGGRGGYVRLDQGCAGCPQG